jgi:hypothetical protein
MRPDQRERLDELSEKLTDVVLDEADPDLWPGQGMHVGDMTQEQRGDRYWCKKNATASIALLLRVQQVTANTPAALGRDALKDKEIDTAIAKADQQAAEFLDKLQSQAYAKKG